VSFLLHSFARRVLQLTIATLLLALLVTQTASFVCSAQCVQHQLGTHGAMAHCHSMLQPDLNAAAVQTCPAGASSFCVADLLAKRQEKTAPPPVIHAEWRPGTLVLGLYIAKFPPAYPPLRSGIGDPPLITPLRV
jgi:hypothetical protein